jgi:hypothetical protein
MLEHMHNDFSGSANAVDDDDIKLNYKSLRGNGGIAVFWKKTVLKDAIPSSVVSM